MISVSINSCIVLYCILLMCDCEYNVKLCMDNKTKYLFNYINVLVIPIRKIY